MTASTKSKQECPSKTKCPADSADTQVQFTARELLISLARDTKEGLFELVEALVYSWTWTWRLSSPYNILLVPVALFVGYVSLLNFPKTGIVAIIGVAVGIVYSISVLLWWFFRHVRRFYLIWRFVRRKQEERWFSDVTDKDS